MNLFIRLIPPKLFLLKMVIIGSFIILLLAYVSKRYFIGFDSQDDRCIPQYSLYLIDKWDKNLIKNRFYAFRATNLEPLYQDGTIMLKQLTGLPGDEVQVTEKYVMINDKPINFGMNLASKLGMRPDYFIRNLTIDSKEYWFSGISETSFDSRYFGSVKQMDIIGRAIPLW
ncbi:S26 family signal peptidase [Thorsellia anophelis]|uniref:Conjugal transfer pilin signal peptidase TrbI n=1 Tax=Thorsellia anophelis DSM 18579 TaxID=1123402 RepID=A0A1I0CZZ9_9GAMM|nr:S26 family signal peptidase [Thorsellia anophelis]SET25382.1 conjugal transfer pilin signal peptidase TrbI [Thorsellia anophelis DSM 18579]